MGAPDLDLWISRARSVTVRAELERRGLWSPKMARQNGVPCPACGGRDRFSVHERKNVFYCRASGAGGEAIALAQHIESCDFFVACEIVTGEPRPTGRAESEAERQAREKERERLRLAAAREHEKQEREFNAFRENERVKCWLIWRRSWAIARTPAEAYLQKRGLYPPSSARLRFAAEHPYWHDGAVIALAPAMIGAMIGPDGRFAGIHQTFLDPSQPRGKLLLADPKTGEILDAKKTRGSWKGATVDLFRVDEPVRCFLGEGIETVLSVFCALAAARSPLLAGAEFRSACNLGNIAGKASFRVAHPTERVARKDGGLGAPLRVAGPDPVAESDDLPMIVLKPTVRELFLLGDGDSDPFATGLALQRAGKRFARAYPAVTVRLAMASPGVDFNDMLQKSREVAA